MNSCSQCGKCCRNHSVLITFRDVREIVNYIPQINLINYITLYEASKEYKDYKCLSENYPLIMLKENEYIIHGYLGLRFKKINSKTTVCPFLNDDLKSCSIHDFKPLICKIYPQKLDKNEKLIWIDGRCTQPWLPEGNHALDLIKLIKLTLKEFKLFRLEVEEWNRDFEKKSRQNFFDFILKSHIIEQIHN